MVSNILIVLKYYIINDCNVGRNSNIDKNCEK